MLVSGPTAATVTGSGEVISSSARATTAGRGSATAGDGGSSTPPSPAAPCTCPARSGCGCTRDSRAPAATGTSDAAGQVQHPQRVLRRLRQLDVAVHGGDQPEVDLGAGQGQQDRQRVVDAGVGVDHQGDGCGHPGILAAAPDTPRAPGAAGVTAPPYRPFPRSERAACRQVTAVKDGSPTRPERLRNGSVTRLRERVAGAGRRGVPVPSFLLVRDTFPGRGHDFREAT